MNYTNYSPAHCNNVLPSNENVNPDWEIVDVESGVEVGTTNKNPLIPIGTEHGAFSMTYLQY